MTARNALALITATLLATTLTPTHATILTAGVADGVMNNNVGVSVDGPNYLILWEGNKLAGMGDVANWTFNAQEINRPVTPVVVARSGGAYTVTGVGTTVTPTATGRQTHNFGVTSGTAAYDATGATEYFLAWQAGAAGAPIKWNANTLASAGQNIWFQGGMTAPPSPGTSLSLTPTAVRAYWVQVEMTQVATTVEATGGVIGPHQTLDTGADLTFVDSTQLTLSGSIGTWSLYSRRSTTESSYVTPMLFRNTTGTDFEIVGIGTTRDVMTGTYTFDFGLVSGVDAFDVGAGNYYMGWRTGDNGIVVGDGLATVPWNATGSTGVYYQPVGNNLHAPGTTLASMTPLNRTYALTFTTVNAIPEPGAFALFGLGLFLIRRWMRRG